MINKITQYGGERVLYLQKEKLREISVSLKNPFWSDVLLCLSEAKPHTDSFTLWISQKSFYPTKF
jgi:hypothetical protein